MQGEGAQAKNSEDYRVISGTSVCLSTPTPIPGSIGYFTPMGAKALGADDSSLAPTASTIMPEPDGQHAAKIAGLLENVDYTALSASQRIALNEACADAIARGTGVPTESVRDEPGGLAGRTLLTARGSGVWLQAFMASSPAGVDWLRDRVYTREFALDLERAVVSAQPSSTQVMLKEQAVDLIEVAPGSLGAANEVSSNSHWSWGLIGALLGLIMCCVLCYAYAVFCAQPVPGTKGTRSARVKSRGKQIEVEEESEDGSEESDWSEKERIFAEARVLEEDTTSSERDRIFAEARALDADPRQAPLMTNVNVPQPSFGAAGAVGSHGLYGGPYGPPSFARRGDYMI
jgi:hypothetical protein